MNTTYDGNVSERVNREKKYSWSLKIINSVCDEPCRNNNELAVDTISICTCVPQNVG